MIQKADLESSFGTSIVTSDWAPWQMHVALALQASKIQSNESEIVRMAKLLARLGGSAESVRSESAEVTGNAVPNFIETLDALSHD
jgi:hypothetical protein